MGIICITGTEILLLVKEAGIYFNAMSNVLFFFPPQRLIDYLRESMQAHTHEHE